MQEPETHLQNAKQCIKIADHMALVTYRLVQEPKFLLTITERLDKGLYNAMKALLAYELKFKRIPAFQDTFENTLTIFKARTTRRYNLKEDYGKLIENVHNTVKKHKESPVEFSRDKTFVICDEKYNLKVISIESIKSTIRLSKNLVFELEAIIKKKG